MFTPDESALKTRLDRLVAINTENPPGREAEAARLILTELQAMGCRAEAVDVLPGRSNVIAIFENGPGPTFAFNTHIDVVPAGDGWTSDPFRLRQAGGQLFGRGSCDAKGPLVAMLDAMQALIADRAGWSGTLIGAFVADEEASSLGAKAYVKTAPEIDYCVIGEPTSCTTVTAHKGSMRPLVQVRGRTAHSGMPDLGINAILKAAPLLRLIDAHHDDLRARRHDLVGTASLTVTRASGGHADNVVPDTCEFLLDRRMIPGESEAQARREIEHLVEQAARDSGTVMEIVEYRPTTGGATETDAAHPVVEAAQGACRHHNGAATPLSGFEGGCDLVHFRSIGAQGVVVGPGSLSVAHQPDEFVPADELVRAALIYRDIAARMLGGGDPVRSQ
jgi:acetylornithine deacetylase/succinyl-diaminopimelate desuccinylase